MPERFSGVWMPIRDANRLFWGCGWAKRTGPLGKRAKRLWRTSGRPWRGVCRGGLRRAPVRFSMPATPTHDFPSPHRRAGTDFRGSRRHRDQALASLVANLLGKASHGGRLLMPRLQRPMGTALPRRQRLAQRARGHFGDQAARATARWLCDGSALSRQAIR